ncbi:regulatory protein [Sesbania bispinosa]|nr:regulatory protein [Sesbania bispinosa]
MGAAADEGMRAHGGPQLLLTALTEGRLGTAWTRTMRTNRGRRSEDVRLGREETRQQEERRREVAAWAATGRRRRSGGVEARELTGRERE